MKWIYLIAKIIFDKINKVLEIAMLLYPLIVLNIIHFRGTKIGFPRGILLIGYNNGRN
jgi:hypothetical protein